MTKVSVENMIIKLQEQMAMVEKKLDIIARRLPQQNQPNQNFQPRQGFSNRPLFKAVCADCHKDCELPFRPAPGRLVYCKECFAKRRNNFSRPPEARAMPAPAMPQALPQIKVQTAKVQKPAAKKSKPAAKKRRK